MFEKIRSFFYSPVEIKDKEPEAEVEEKIEEPKIPDVLEVPWEDIVQLKNIEIARKRVHDQLKEMLYNAKMAERNAFQTLDVYREVEKEKLESLHEKYNIPADGSYDLELPETTGRRGYFKKRNK
jgi:hypothetical protein